MNVKAYIAPLTRYALRFRKARFALFQRVIADFGDRPLRILDVGGREIFWHDMGFDLDKHHVSILNTDEETIPPKSKNVVTLVGDGCDMRQFARGDFDVVFSNSVLEHVGSWERQQAMAREVARLSDHFFIQTPNFWFPLEPHFHVPAFQMLPIPVRTRLIQRFALGCMPRIPDAREARQLAEDTRLLTKKEMALLFPDARIEEEHIFGITKSLIAMAPRSA
jgi:hypothetical protein